MQGFNFEPDKEFADHLDETDELKGLRQEFLIRDDQLIYLDGNSLGRLPLASMRRVQQAVQVEWGEKLIRSWNEGWFDAPLRIGEKIATLIGAAPGQTIVSDCTSVNLFKLVMSALSLQKGRPKIISDELNFPSDLYVLQGCISLLGDRHELVLLPSSNGINVEQEEIAQAIDDQTALLTLSHVCFKSGHLYDAQAITAQAQEKGALVLWDLSHSTGAVPVHLDQWGADLAVGCTYKYLNGGPGAPAFLYVAQRHLEKLYSPIWAWFGQNNPFDFNLKYSPEPGIKRFLSGTPPVLSLLSLEAALDILLQTGMQALRKRSLKLGAYLQYLMQSHLNAYGFTLGSPYDPYKRGSHLSLRHPEGYRICQALIHDMSVIPDFREPDNIRLGLSPLYTSFAEIWEAVQRLQRIMQNETYKKYSPQKSSVT